MHTLYNVENLPQRILKTLNSEGFFFHTGLKALLLEWFLLVILSLFNFCYDEQASQWKSCIPAGTAD